MSKDEKAYWLVHVIFVVSFELKRAGKTYAETSSEKGTILMSLRDFAQGREAYVPGRTTVET